MGSVCSCENVATAGLKLGDVRFWELLAHGSRAEGTFWGGAAFSELFHKEFSAGGSDKMTQ